MARGPIPKSRVNTASGDAPARQEATTTLRNRAPGRVRVLAAVLAVAALGACKPLDDTMVFIFGRSMRDQRSFDPYENTRPAPENS